MAEITETTEIADAPIVETQEGVQEAEGGQDNAEVAEESIYATLNKQLGVEYDFSDIEDDSYEGLARYVKKTNDLTTQSIYNQLRNDFPDLYELIQIGYQQGDVKQAIRELANVGSQLQVGEDTQIQKNIVAEDMRMSGYFTENEIQQRLETLEDEGKLLGKATELAERMNSSIKAQQDEILNKQKQAIEYRDAKADENLKGLKSIIDGGILNTVRIPDTVKDAFYNYILNEGLEVDDRGNIYKVHKIAGIEDLQRELYVFSKGNLDKMVEVKKVTQSVKDRLNKQTKVETQQKNTNNQARSFKEQMDFILSQQPKGHNQ